VRQVDRILVFEDGRIVEEGTHDQLVVRPDGCYRRLYDTQAGAFGSDLELGNHRQRATTGYWTSSSAP
jgi:ATP-binding cassette subfamily B protein